MVRLNIDNLNYDSPARNIQEAIQSASEKISTDRMVSEVLLGGKRLSDWMEEFGGAFPEQTEITIRTVNRNQWAATWLDSALCSVRRLQQSFMRAAESLYDQDSRSAQRLFSSCLEGLKQFLYVIDLSREACPDFAAVNHNGVNSVKLHAELVRLSSQLTQLLKAQDVDGMADRVDYALLPHLHLWNQALTHHQESQY